MCKQRHDISYSRGSMLETVSVHFSGSPHQSGSMPAWSFVTECLIFLTWMQAHIQNIKLLPPTLMALLLLLGQGAGFIIGFWHGRLCTRLGKREGLLFAAVRKVEATSYTAGIPFQGISWTKLSFSWWIMFWIILYQGYNHGLLTFFWTLIWLVTTKSLGTCFHLISFPFFC